MKQAGSKTLFLVSGVLGPKRHGNQSMKNTILGYQAAGYHVFHFGLVARSDARHNFASLETGDTYRYVGMPGFLLGAARRLRSGRGTHRAVAQPIPATEETVDPGASEVNTRQILLARAYLCFEIVRVLLYALVRKPSLLYGYEIWGAPIASSVGRVLGVKTVLRFQGTYLTPRNRDHPPLKYHMRAMQGHADGIVMANDGTRGDEALQSLGIDSARVLFIANGIDAAVFDAPDNHRATERIRRELGAVPGGMVLGIFNRFYPFKRIDRAVAVLRRIRRDGVDALLAIGGHGGPLEQQLKDLVRSQGLEPHVCWLGAIPHELMSAYYRACDVVLVMNDYANTGNQVFEAISLGVPLLAVDDGINSRLFGDCPWARFVASRDLRTIDGEVVRKLAAARGPYASRHLMGWPERMRREIAWVEKL